MITHYLKVAFRNLLKYKTQTVISVMGLAIGLAFFIYGLHWLNYETSYDSFYPEAERSYLVYTHDENNKVGYSPTALADFIREYLPEAEAVTHSYKNLSFNYRFDETIIRTPHFLSVDTCFIQIFPQTLVCGKNPERPDEIIVSESFAKQHFRLPEKALGITLTQEASRGILTDARQLRVVGVMTDAPQNANMAPEGYYIKWQAKGIDINNPNYWNHDLAYTHLRLKKGVKVENFTNHLEKAISQLDVAKDKSFKVIPLHLQHFEFASEESFSYSAISMFTIATGLLLCCVLFNFINLFLNRYYQRIREVKLRKSMGASTPKLLLQVMVEIMSYVFIGLLLCGCLIELSLPLFEDIFGIGIPKSDIMHLHLYVSIATLIVMQVLLLLPSWQFIRSVGRQALTGRPQSHSRNQTRRIGLGIQLVICLFFLASATALYQQLRFMTITDLGINIQHIVELRVNSFEQKGKDMLKEIHQLPMVENHITTSQYMISKDGLYTDNGYQWRGKTDEDKTVVFAPIELTKHADQMFNLRLKEGRTFMEEDWTGAGNPKDFLSGRPVLNKVLVSESAARAMRLEQPLGEIIRVPLEILGREPLWTNYEIIGVVRDFHPQGMKAEPSPTIFFQNFRFAHPIHYWQVTPGTEADFLKAVNRLAEKHGWTYEGINAPPILLMDKMKKLNKSETATFRLFAVLTFLCILISLFGIFSISASTITQRRKEIAIRKVMGATAGEVIRMFFREYSWLVGVSAIIAFPFFYYTISRWLEQYAYHVSISIGMYIALSGITILLVLLTVFRQVTLAANENPADVVKSE